MFNGTIKGTPLLPSSFGKEGHVGDLMEYLTMILLLASHT